MNRRDFFKLLAGSLGLTTAAALLPKSEPEPRRGEWEYWEWPQVIDEKPMRWNQSAVIRWANVPIGPAGVRSRTLVATPKDGRRWNRHDRKRARRLYHVISDPSA